MNIEQIKEGAKLIKDGLSRLDSGPLDFYLTRLAQCYEFLLTFAPFKVGDIVQLAKTPVINEHTAWGWMGSEHFLKKGARARVASVECDGYKFGYMLVFEADSWINRDGLEIAREPHERGHFYFKDEYVNAVSEESEHGR